MAFLQANIYSNVLEMEVNVNVILPQETVKKVGTSTQAALTDIPCCIYYMGWEGITVSGLAEPLLSGMSLIWGLLSLCRPRI